MAYTPLAQASDFDATPLAEIIRDMSTQQQTSLLIKASRSIEAYCERRLSPFSITETHRADDFDVEDQDADYAGPLPSSALLGMSRARSMGGASTLVRTLNLREWPPLWPDLWVGSVTSVTAYPPLAGSVSVATSGIQFEPDTAHIRFALGTYIPMGSTVAVVYSGGYNPVPDELVQACLFEAAEQAFIWISPGRSGDLNIADLRLKREELLAPYCREQA